MTYITPKGYFGGNWHAGINNYQSYLNARRLRKWKKEDIKNRHIIFSIWPASAADHLDNMYFIPPVLILDQVHNVIKPDINNIKHIGWAPPGVRNIEVRCEMLLNGANRKRNNIYYDTEDLIGKPL